MNETKTPEQIAAEAAASQETINNVIDAAEKAAETATETPKAEPEKKDPASIVSAWYKPTWKKSAYVAGGLAVLGAVAFGLMKFLGDSAEESSESSDGE